LDLIARDIVVNGCINMLKYAISHNFFLFSEHHKDILNAYRHYGKSSFKHMKISLSYIQYLHTKYNCILPEELCDIACKVGNLKLLKYAHMHGCRMNNSTIEYAATKNIKCLQYVLKNGIKYNKYVAICAIKHGKLGCLKYLFENNYMQVEELFGMLLESADLNQFQCFKYIFNKLNEMHPTQITYLKEDPQFILEKQWHQKYKNMILST